MHVQYSNRHTSLLVMGWPVVPASEFCDLQSESHRRRPVMMDVGRGEENKNPKPQLSILRRRGREKHFWNLGKYVHAHVPTSKGKINIDLYFFFRTLSIGKFSWLKREVPQWLTALLDPGLIRSSRTKRTYWDSSVNWKQDNSLYLKGLSHQIFKAFLWPTISNLYFLRGRWWFLNFFI